MKSHMKLLSSAALVAAALTPCFAQTTATTKPVGYRTETITAGVFNLLSPNLSNKIGAAGVIDAAAATVLTDNDVDFAAGFTAGAHLTLQLTNGGNSGVVAEVTAFTQHTITTSQDISSLVTAGTTSYELRETETVASLFGAANEAGLLTGTDLTADVIWIPGGGGAFTRVYRAVATPPFITAGWKRVGGGNAEAANTPVVFTDSILVQRRGATNLDIVFVGHVRTIPSKVAVEGALFNYVSRVIPVGVQLGQSTLETSLQQGSEATADLIWNPNGLGGYARYYFAIAAPPFITAGWKQVGGGNADQATVELKSGYIIQRKAATPVNVTLVIPPGLDL